MNLLSGLEKFGLDQMDTDHLLKRKKVIHLHGKHRNRCQKKNRFTAKLSSYWINPSVVRYVIMFSVQEW